MLSGTDNVTATQKHRQKSHDAISAISLGAYTCIYSLMPVFPKKSTMKALVSDTNTVYVNNSFIIMSRVLLSQ